MGGSLRKKISKHLTAIFGFSLFAILLTTISALFFLRAVLTRTNRTVLEDVQEITRLEKLRSASEWRVAAYRGYLLTGEAKLKANFRAADIEVKTLLAALREAANTPANDIPLRLLEQLEQEHAKVAEKAIALKEKGAKTQTLLEYFDREVLPRRDKFTGLIETIQKQMENELRESKRKMNDEVSRSVTYIIGLTLLSLVLNIAIAFLLQQTLSRQAKQLAQANEDLERFSSVASHDLSSPLNTITSFLGLLKRRSANELDADSNEYIEFAMDGAVRMRKLIDKLLDYARAGNRKLEAQVLDLNAVVDEALKNLATDIEQRGAVIKHSELPTIPGDRVQLAQLFQNLIGNAIKFQKDRKPFVNVSAESKGKYWRLSVQDNGIGFDSEFAGQIFEPFQRLHGMKEYPGSGLGLSVCKKIIERHGGRIWAKSKPGDGATFFIELPKDSKAMKLAS